ncbi:putative Ig domain-containing protein [Rhizobium sp.]|uniref:putative Ig domain-containing protein n=1 Tax=Rhizobium sp. TaxID=391 RepID=UPI002AA7FB1F
MDSISPNSGSIRGGTSVNISGTNLSNVTSIKFGGTDASSFTINSATSITATSPAHNTTGTVDVAVSDGTNTSTLSNAFTYAPTVPDAPTIGTATAGNGQATVSFTAPASDGGAAISHYTVTASPGGATATGTTSPITVTGLTNGTAYTFTVTATNSVETGDPSSASNSVTPTATATAPGAPTIGTATAGDGQATVSFSAPASDGGAAINHYTVTASPGGATATGTTSPITVTGLTNGTAYTFTVTATNSVETGSASATSNSVTPIAALQAPIANAVSATVTANSSANAITLNITGGAAASVSVASTPSHGTATATGTSITYTPTTGYSGSDSFTYTATNTGGTSTAATVSITVSAATLSFSPAAGTLPNGTVGTAYSQTVSVSNGTAPYDYEIISGSLPDGLSISGGSTSSKTISGTPTTVGTSSISVRVTDANSITTTVSYGITINAAAPVANGVSATIAANSSANAITLNITGGTAASVTVDTQASHGIATASGTSITYTPTSGYSGSDSFTYTATNTGGTSTAATVSITVTAPTFSVSPSAGALAAATVGTAYSQTLAVSGGTAPYSYAVTSGTLPAGVSLNTSTGTFSGTPTTAGNYSFTITVTDNNGATTSLAYTLTVNAPAADLVFSPTAGSLTDAMAGEKYSQQISASGGTTPLTFSLLSGSLPNGLTLSTSGELSGTLAADTQNDYTFTIKVTDANNISATTSYKLKVKARSVTVASQIVNVASGSSPPDTRLDKSATGGPFNSGQLVAVQPPNAGTATLTMGDYAQVSSVSPVGWYLKFTPTTGYSGSVVITFSLSSGLGSSTGTVTYNLNYDPAKVATEVDGLVRDFVKSRQSMISSTIKVPGLLERRNIENARDPITTRMSPSSSGMTLGFSTSLAQIEAAHNNADRAAGENPGGISSSPFNVWLNGSFLMHNRNDNGSKWGSFGMFSVGADYLLTDKALVGLSFHFDRMTDPTDADAKLTGNGWLFGPYTSLEISKGVFWDTSLLYGGSSNNIDTAFWDGTFDTKRWMADTAIKGQWYLDDATVLTPKLRTVYFSEQVKDYTVSNAAGDALTIDGFTSEQLRVSLGAEIARRFTLNNDTKLTPKVGVTGGFSGINGSGAFGTISTGMSVETANDWNLDFSLLFNLEGDGDKSGGAQTKISRKF